jgi:nitric oxide reductase NorQ protein
VANGLDLRRAAIAAIAGPLTDDRALRAGLITMIDTYVGVCARKAG